MNFRASPAFEFRLFDGAIGEKQAVGRTELLQVKPITHLAGVSSRRTDMPGTCGGCTHKQKHPDSRTGVRLSGC